MIPQFRAYHERQLAEAQAALDVPDEELEVTTYLGAYARRNLQHVT